MRAYDIISEYIISTILISILTSTALKASYFFSIYESSCEVSEGSLIYSNSYSLFNNKHWEYSNCPSPGSPIYVDRTANGNNTGLDWTNAFNDLHDALVLSKACSNNPIWIAQGSYSPSVAHDIDNNGTLEDREKTFYIDHPVQIYGGFKSGDNLLSDRDSLDNKTFLTGVIANSMDTAYHVVVMTADSINDEWQLNSLTIQNGRAQGAHIVNQIGSGIYATSQYANELRLSNCAFLANMAIGNGGGIYISARGDSYRSNIARLSPSISNCSFSNNSSLGSGGGMYLSTIAIGDTTYAQPNALAESYFSPRIIDCSFLNNSAERSGGGIYSFIASWTNADTISGAALNTTPYFENCSFLNNTSNFYGGGLCLISDATTDVYAISKPEVHILQNHIVTPTLINCEFIDNHAERDGGGLYAEVDIDGEGTYQEGTQIGAEADIEINLNFSPDVSYCTFTNNSSNRSGGGVDLIVSSSTLGFYNTLESPSTTTSVEAQLNPIFTNSSWSNNISKDGGGGMTLRGQLESQSAQPVYNSIDLSPIYTNCSFLNNSTDYNGGAIELSALCGPYDPNSPVGYSIVSPSLVNCSFNNNSAGANGGGLVGTAFTNAYSEIGFNAYSEFKAEIINCTFANNSAVENGGAIIGEANAFPESEPNIDVAPILMNNIIWNNTASEGSDLWFNRSDNTQIAHSIISDNGIHIESNTSNLIDTSTVFIHTDPLFINSNPNMADLGLQQGSPAIDLGSNSDIRTIIDIKGNPRLNGSKVDLGAYEHGNVDNCDQNIFLHPQEFDLETNSYKTNDLIYATNKINSGSIIYNSSLGTELDALFEILPGAIFEIKLDGCP